MININLLETVKLLCKEKNISLRKLQSDLDLSQGSISKWNKSTPSSNTIQRVATYFNVSTDYLMGNTKFRNHQEMINYFDQQYLPAVLVELIDISKDLNTNDMQALVKIAKSLRT